MTLPGPPKDTQESEQRPAPLTNHEESYALAEIQKTEYNFKDNVTWFCSPGLLTACLFTNTCLTTHLFDRTLVQQNAFA